MSRFNTDELMTMLGYYVRKRTHDIPVGTKVQVNNIHSTLHKCYGIVTKHDESEQWYWITIGGAAGPIGFSMEELIADIDPMEDVMDGLDMIDQLLDRMIKHG